MESRENSFCRTYLCHSYVKLAVNENQVKVQTMQYAYYDEHIY